MFIILIQKLGKITNDKKSAKIYLFKVKNRNTRKKICEMCEICSKLTLKTPFSSASIVDSEQVNISWDELDFSKWKQ